MKTTQTIARLVVIASLLGVGCGDAVSKERAAMGSAAGYEADKYGGQGNQSPTAPGPNAQMGEAADDGTQAPSNDEDPTANWVQLSTDDSTSMASAQLFKAQGLWYNSALLAHEFVNYYDPPTALFDEEAWAIAQELTSTIEFGIKADHYTGTAAVACEDGEAVEPCEIEADIVELLFHMRAERVAQAERRGWNVFVCVDVSGSMEGEKIAFVRDALAEMLGHFKAGDRLTLVTFDSYPHDVFIDYEWSEHETDIRAAFEGLRAGSSTNMIGGLTRAYDLAQQNFDTELLQRVLLFSDGAANVGDTDVETFAQLTRINGQEGIYLSGVGVGPGYDSHRMDQLTDAGKGAHVFLPNAQEVSLIFGDYFPKLIEVAADNIAIELTLPAGIRLESFSGEEVSTNPEERLQNIVLAAGDDMTFVARFVIEREAAMQESATLTLRLRPLATGSEEVVEVAIHTVADLKGVPGALFTRTRIIDGFGKLAASGDLDPAAVEALRAALDGYQDPDWGLVEIDGLLESN